MCVHDDEWTCHLVKHWPLWYSTILVLRYTGKAYKLDQSINLLVVWVSYVCCQTLTALTLLTDNLNAIIQLFWTPNYFQNKLWFADRVKFPFPMPGKTASRWSPNLVKHRFFSQDNSHHHQWFNVRLGQQFSDISTSSCTALKPNLWYYVCVCLSVCVCIQ